MRKRHLPGTPPGIGPNPRAPFPPRAAEERAQSEPPTPPGLVESGHERRDPAAAAEALPAVAPAQARTVIGQQLAEERAVVAVEARQIRRIPQPRRVELAVAPP